MKTMMLVAALGVLAVAGTMYGTVIAEHTGANDPTGEGWVVNGGGVVTGPLAPDGDHGLDAWFVDDDGTGQLDHQDTEGSGPHDFTSLETDAWTLELNMRMVDMSDAPDNGAVVMLWSGGRRWFLRFGAQDDGDPIVRLLWAIGDHALLELDGLGSGYHLYELRGPAGGAAPSFYVDGALTYADYPGENLVGGGDEGKAWLAWGSGSDDDTGHANYNLVRLTVGDGGACSPGDADGDGDVDDDDLSLLLANWGSETAGCEQGEFSGEPPVSDDDLSLLLANWTGPQTAAVPEPASVAVVLLGASLLARRRRS